ncbi:flagellar basal-body rod protein FlgF [Methylobacterium nonmethylotrophicum]|uniref:Flagellar basal-body rod protein FlgF n=1 Tax=Methylobacterium nonmethylotrophicum TaxID=1141884 RepID=A0A4Z0NHM5_9HYPH|nr:flagellar basal-body rod protein FlgF [Methylobacterium nonmethylotrophicum]TGD95612.1 flagellar basal-body rod protein FlgF [Methylobacterium nonmethylotrophicum]
MQNSLYVNLSAQVALDKRLTTTANNVANMATAGFRAEETKFSALLAQATKGAVAFVNSGDTYLTRASGPIAKTDSPLDVAIQGDAWLGIAGTSGPAYTRDGRLTMDATGQLRTLTGQAVLDPGGSPLLLDPQAGPPTIARDGSIYQGTNQVGALGVFTLDKKATLARAPGNAVTPSLPARPVQDFTGIGVVQGYVEGSNVNPIMEMTKLITIQRAFESAAAASQEAESSLQSAVKSLSPQGS